MGADKEIEEIVKTIRIPLSDDEFTILVSGGVVSNTEKGVCVEIVLADISYPLMRSIVETAEITFLSDLRTHT